MYWALVDYKQKHGDCDVPVNWRKNHELGKWVAGQRERKSQGVLSSERANRLEELGFRWTKI